LVAQIAFEDVEQVFANDAIDQPADDDTPSGEVYRLHERPC
jgi:hypothetical protein